MITSPDKIDQIFWNALQLASEEERSAYLERACGADHDLRQLVEKLLRAQPKAAAFLEEPFVEPHAPDDDTIQEGPGAVLGPYKLLEQIGEGGFGVVFMAEQQQPVRRKVALKVLKPGMDSRQVSARFEAERQALALMDHPNIAKVLDGGQTGSGRPYFVMDLVKGVPITQYCDQNQQTARERLELFVQVCQAVQHAHQKGIIHRDVKPSNVLVSRHDGTPVVKVIDFGIAKALGQQLTDKTLFTNFAQMIGTPLYMSPEQAGMSDLDVDTRSDIYSLGVLLYELLTGTTPFDEKRFREAGFDEMRRIIREEEPPRPSTRLSTLGQAATTASTNRKSDPKQLSRLFRGELDWIVMKALEKDRNRRYESASAFASDVQRYLNDEPVLACPPSAIYRLKKFIRRNRGPVLAVAVVLLALVGGIVGTTWGLVRAERANELTKKRLTQIEKGNEILSGVFSDLDIKLVKQSPEPLEAVLAERLVMAAEQLEGDSVGHPVVVATLQDRLGTSLRSLGFPDRAIPIFQKSRQTRRELLGLDHADTISSMVNLALAYVDAGKLDLAMSLFEETVPLAKARLGPDHRLTLSSMNGLAGVYRLVGKHDLALPLFEETFQLRKASLGPDDPHTLNSMNGLAVAYEDADKFDLSLPLKEESLRLTKAKFGPDHPSTLVSMNNLAEGYRVTGKLDLALKLFEETLKLMKAKLGPDHPSTLLSMNNVAFNYHRAGKLKLALPLAKETHERMKAKLGPDHFNTLISMTTLANCYRDVGKFDLAVPLYEKHRERTIARFGPNNPDTLSSTEDLAYCCWLGQRLARSVPLYEELLKRREAMFGRQHPQTVETIANLGVNYADAGRLERAFPLLEEAYRASKKYPNLRWIGSALLDRYRDAGKTTEAAALVTQMLADARRTLPPDSPPLAGTLAQLGSALLAAKAFAEAEPVLRECLTIRQKKEPEAWTTFNTRSLLGGALSGQARSASKGGDKEGLVRAERVYREAEPLLLAGYEGMKKREKTIPPQARARLPEAADRLIELYKVTKRPDEMKKWQAEKATYLQANKSAPPKKT
jgi:serine/threonine protein kinase/tetratricopeptide (TPR) repeat protein